MKDTEISFDRVNKFLKKHTFNLPNRLFELFDVNVKFQILGTRTYISVGEEKDHIIYSITLMPSDEESDRVIKFLWGSRSEDETIQISTYDHKGFTPIISQSNKVLSDFLKYFSLNLPVMCVEIKSNFT